MTFGRDDPVDLTSHEVFEAVVRKYKNWMYRLAGQYVEQPADQDDVVQYAWLIVWQGRHKYTGPVGKLPFWLKKAIRYAALNIYRQHQRFPMTGCDFSREIDPCAAEPAVGREKAEQTEDQHQQIDRAMATFRFLPKQQRSVVRLRMEGLRNEDIAKKMRLSKSCVGSHLHRARKKIRREIEESPTL